jgi:hypothetical protein
MKVLVFDTETSGLPKTKVFDPSSFDNWPLIVQLSCALYDVSTNEIKEWSDDIVKVPENYIISEESIKFHNIPNEISAKSGINIEEVIDKLMAPTPFNLRLPCHQNANTTSGGWPDVYGRLEWDGQCPTITGGFDSFSV